MSRARCVAVEKRARSTQPREFHLYRATSTVVVRHAIPPSVVEGGGVRARQKWRCGVAGRSVGRRVPRGVRHDADPDVCRWTGCVGPSRRWRCSGRGLSPGGRTAYSKALGYDVGPSALQGGWCRRLGASGDHRANPGSDDGRRPRSNSTQTARPCRAVRAIRHGVYRRRASGARSARTGRVGAGDLVITRSRQPAVGRRGGRVVRGLQPGDNRGGPRRPDRRGRRGSQRPGGRDGDRLGGRVRGGGSDRRGSVPAGECGGRRFLRRPAGAGQRGRPGADPRSERPPRRDPPVRQGGRRGVAAARRDRARRGQQQRPGHRCRSNVGVGRPRRPERRRGC